MKFSSDEISAFLVDLCIYDKPTRRIKKVMKLLDSVSCGFSDFEITIKEKDGTCFHYQVTIGQPTVDTSCKKMR